MKGTSKIMRNKITDEELKQIQKESREQKAKIREINKAVKDGSIKPEEAKAQLEIIIERCKQLNKLLDINTK